jgi:hypothetical protein
MAARLSALQPHPDSPEPRVQHLSAGAERRAVTLVFEYRLCGELAALRLPPLEPLQRRDGLWRHSCFEAFIAAAGAAEYFEFNFSPRGEWAAYRFESYRAAMRPLVLAAVPRIEVRRDATELVLGASVRLEEPVAPAAFAPLRVGLAAVLEDESGRLSYWALRHAPGKADFHHRDGFVLELDAPVAEA